MKEKKKTKNRRGGDFSISISFLPAAAFHIFPSLLHQLFGTFGGDFPGDIVCDPWVSHRQSSSPTCAAYQRFTAPLKLNVAAPVIVCKKMTLFCKHFWYFEASQVLNSADRNVLGKPRSFFFITTTGFLSRTSSVLVYDLSLSLSVSVCVCLVRGGGGG